MLARRAVGYAAQLAPQQRILASARSARNSPSSNKLFARTYASGASGTSSDATLPPASQPDIPLPSSPKRINILGIESSCDDSCAAVVQGVPTPEPSDPSLPLRPPLQPLNSSTKSPAGGAGPWKAEVLANVVLKQDHYVTRGVHPLVASKAHAVNVPRAVRAALAETTHVLAQRAGQTSSYQSAGQAAADGPSTAFGPDMIDAIAVTQGPGMAASLASGLVAAKTLAAVWGKPLIYVHHMAAHALVPLLVPRHQEIRTPFLAALVSGGHSLLVLVNGPEEYTVVGQTVDEAMGRVLDKVAVILGLVWGPAAGPGGPTNAGAAVEGAAAEASMDEVERLRQAGLKFPMRVSTDEGVYDMTFSGIKMSLEQQVRKLANLPRQKRTAAEALQASPQNRPKTEAFADSSALAEPLVDLQPQAKAIDSTQGDLALEADPELTVAPVLDLDGGPIGELDVQTVRAIAYLVQEAVIGMLTRRIIEWLGGDRKKRGKLNPEAPGAGVHDVVLAGGVAANTYLRTTLASDLAAGGRQDVAVHCAPAAWCTDNAAMIAHAGLALYVRRTHDLARTAIPTWPLEQMRTPPKEPLARIGRRTRRVQVRPSNKSDKQGSV